MPVSGFHPLDRGLEARAADLGVIDAAGCQIETDTADAQLVHGVEIAVRRLVVDDGDAARGRAARLHAEQGRGVVGAVDARRHDHHTLDVQCLVHGRHFLRRRQFWRIDAPRKERKFGGIAVNMGMAVAGAGRHIEIYRCRWLCCSGARVSVGHDHSSRNGGKQNTASGEHRFTPSGFRSCFWRAQTFKMPRY